MNWNTRYDRQLDAVEVSLNGQVVGHLDIDKQAALDLKRRLRDAASNSIDEAICVTAELGAMVGATLGLIIGWIVAGGL